MTNHSTIQRPLVNSLSAHDVLMKLTPVANPAFGLILELKRERQYYDEPKFWYYNASINPNFKIHGGNTFASSASGFSFFSHDEALLKCLAESIERFCNYHFESKFTTTHASIKDCHKEIIPIESFARYSTDQLSKPEYQRFVFTNTKKIHWTDCVELSTDSKKLIPCNAVYLSCPYIHTEPLLYPPISTGVAGGSTIEEAIVNGMYEAIERDAYSIAFLQKIPSKKIQLNKISNSKIQFLLETTERYSLELICLDLTTDLKIPVIGAVIIDKTNIGKAISIGLKCHVDPITAILGAITEAFHTRGWIRQEHEARVADTNNSNVSSKSDFIRRGLWWYPRSKIHNLDFWVETPSYSSISLSETSLSASSQLTLIKDRLSANNCEIFWKDITHVAFKKIGYFVVKVIVPQLQPLVFDEKLPLSGGHRLHCVPVALGYKQQKHINTDPNPFL